MNNCIECGKLADAPEALQTESYPICAECLSEGWISDSVEIATEFSIDPELRGILQKKDLL